MTLFSYKTLKVGLAVLLLLVAVVSLFVYKRVIEGPDCFVSDLPYKLSSKIINNDTYSVYAIIAGFHDKSQVFYLFKEPVSFDDCGHFDNTPIFFSSLELALNKQGVLAINVNGVEKFELLHFEGESILLEDIQVNWLPE